MLKNRKLDQNASALHITKWIIKNKSDCNSYVGNRSKYVHLLSKAKLYNSRLEARNDCIKFGEYVKKVRVDIFES